MILKAEFANGSARPFHVATKEELGGFDPVPGDCHGNAQRWVACPALASWANGSPRGVEMPAADRWRKASGKTSSNASMVSPCSSRR